MTLRPHDVGESEIRTLLDAGVGLEGVVDALSVAFCFNLIDRVADSLGFEVVTQERFDRGADHLLKRGYL